MTLITSVPLTHAEPVAALAQAALAKAMQEGADPRLSVVRERWARRMKAAADELRPVCSPTVAAAVDAFTQARLKENADDDEQLSCEQIAARDERLSDAWAALADAPAQTFGDVGAKIALSMETENGGALLRRDRAEAVVRGDKWVDVSLYAAASAYLDCLRLSRAPLAGPPLQELIEVHAAAKARTRALDTAACSTSYAEDDARANVYADWEAASDAETAAYSAVRDYNARSVSDLARMVAFLQAEGEALENTADERAVVAAIARLAEPGPLRSVPWAEAAAEVAAAQARCDAASEDGPEEEDVAAGDAHATAEVRLEQLPAPTLAAFVQKLAIRIRFEQRSTETTDDTLARLLADPDYLAWSLAVHITDVVTLARIAGEDVPLYPRAMNARLKYLGVTVSPGGFILSDGLLIEAEALINTFSDEQAYTLMAAAWIDAYLAVDGGICMFDVGNGERVPYFWSDLTPDHDAEQDRLLSMLSTPRATGQGAGVDYRLRPAVVKLVTEQLAERGVLTYGRSAS